MPNIVCSGPGPHIPASGILGTGTHPVEGMRCAAPECQPQGNPAVDIAYNNSVTIKDRAATALTNNVTFLALGSPSNAQVVAQVKALTRQVNGLIRLTINSLDDVSDA